MTAEHTVPPTPSGSGPLFALLWQLPQEDVPSREDLDEMRELLVPELEGIEGYAGMTVVMDQATGDLYATTYWHSEPAMRASMARGVALTQAAVVMTGGGAAEARTCNVLFVQPPPALVDTSPGRTELDR